MLKSANSFHEDQLETPEQNRRRWNSNRIVYLTMFFDSLSFSIVLASLWPYLQKVSAEPELNPTYLGWASVSFHVTGIFVDFIMGYWTNKRGSLEPLLISFVFFGFGNFLYGYAGSCGKYGVLVIILSRGMIGLSTGVNVVARSALANSTTLKERTTAMAHMSIMQGVGFAFGPAVQLLSIPLGDKGAYIPLLRLHINLYTVPAFISVMIAIMNTFLITGYYYEYCINIYKDEEENEIENFRELLRKGNTTDFTYDRTAIFILLILYFIAQKAFALYETILPPLTMNMLAWTREETSFYASLIFLSAGLIAIFAFAITELLEKVASDRLLLVIGFILIFFGFAIHLPWGESSPLLKLSNNTLNLTNTKNIGCPEEYSWCKSIPKLYIPQILLGTIFLSIGYPFVMVFTSSLYSKVLGPGPQGLMQSWFGAIGGIARITAPVIITYSYVDLGPRWTFISEDAFVLLSIFIFIFSYRKLVPYHKFIISKNGGVLNELVQTNFKSDKTLLSNVNYNDNSISDVDIETNEVLRQSRWSLIDRGSFYDELRYSSDSGTHV